MSIRSSQPTKVARFDWGGGPTRVMVTFEDKGPAKATAVVTHERLSDADAASTAKTLWRERLAALKALLESTGPIRPDGPCLAAHHNHFRHGGVP